MAMMRPETEMKDSGIEWIGDIPANWGKSKLKYLGGYINGYAFKPSDWSARGRQIIRIQDLTGSNSGEPNYFDGTLDEKYRVVNGDILVSWAATLDAFVWTKEDGWLNQHIFKAVPNEKIVKGYFLWLLKVAMDNMNNDDKHGIVMQHVTIGLFNNYVVPLAPYTEQQSIADYLDETCSKIDEIIAEAKASIDEYKELKQSVIFEAVTKGLDKNVEMKDSGVKWIGEIPATWDVLRIKDIGAARNGLTYSPNDQVDSGKGTLVLRSSNVQNGQIVFDDNVYVNKDIPDNLMLDEGDILICSRNGSRRLIGKNAIVPESGKYTFGAFMMVLKPFNDNKKYIHWILNSGVFGYYLPMFFTSTINQLTRENFRNMQIPYCMDVNVQKDIVEYLDKKCELFDSLITEKESLINDLEAYKKSLIYEVVTGKRRVV